LRAISHLRSLSGGRDTPHAALGAALLVELALMERISVAPAEAGRKERGRITVLDLSPTDDPELDAVLVRLEQKDGQKVKNLISPMSSKPISAKLRERLLDRMVARGLLGEARSAVLGLRRYPALDSEPEREICSRLSSALVDGLTPSERTVALVGLLDAAGILTKVVSSGDKKLVKARAKKLGDGDWAAKAVKDAIAEMTAVLVSTGAN
ncbi:MAG: GPP34 family phosphoprotein, partial [Microlunatus sp.]|nr:GPP34 family phosphoprotein [Microlunatus sp.]MDN5803875.1 GPP34 family phosphoprotein [Microlunatus sp.]